MEDGWLNEPFSLVGKRVWVAETKTMAVHIHICHPERQRRISAQPTGFFGAVYPRAGGGLKMTSKLKQNATRERLRHARRRWQAQIFPHQTPHRQIRKPFGFQRITVPALLLDRVHGRG